MTQNKLLYIIFSAAFILTACTGNFEDINRNPYQATNEEMNRGGYATGAVLLGLQNLVIPTQENLHQFAEVLSAGEFGGYVTDIQPRGEGTFATYNPPHNWNLAPFDDILKGVYPLYLPLAAQTDDPITLALAKLFRVAAMHRVTDIYGPIPYSKVGAEGALTAPYDSQEDVYKKMLEELDEVITVLTDNRYTDAANYAKFDNVYSGNIEKWGKFANSLKLRMAIRMAYVAPTLAKQTAESAVGHTIGVLSSNDDNAFLQNITNNPWYLEVNSWNLGGEARVRADILSYMNGYADPRREKYFTVSEFTSAGITNGYIGMRGGIIFTNKTPLLPCSRMIVTPTTPFLWMNAAEVAFLKAEGALRGWSMGGTAETLYNEGITLSFQQHGATGVDAYINDNVSTPVAYTDPTGNTSYNFGPNSYITIKWNEGASLEQKLERIITQKWIAIFPLCNEAWAEFRRTGYPKLAPVVENKSSGAVPAGEFIKRLIFTSTEYEQNRANVHEAVKLLGGPDSEGTKLWWDKKN
jgi:hypothetical protein